MLARFDLSSASWRTSSHSNGNGGSCVEVADGVPGVLPVRDSKVPHGAFLVIPAAAWTGFVTAVRAERFTRRAG